MLSQRRTGPRDAEIYKCKMSKRDEEKTLKHEGGKVQLSRSSVGPWDQFNDSTWSTQALQGDDNDYD